MIYSGNATFLTIIESALFKDFWGVTELLFQHVQTVINDKNSKENVFPKEGYPTLSLELDSQHH